jgi:uncharacterized membrane protein
VVRHGGAGPGRGQAIARRPWATVLVGAAALTAWDLFLDPQMVEEGYWTWPGGGPYRDIPLSNYAGWFATAAVVMVLLRARGPWARPGTEIRDDQREGGWRGSRWWRCTRGGR